jgi:transposase
MTTHYIGADVDSNMTELADDTGRGRPRTFRVPTTIPALREVLGTIGGRKVMTIEEGPMAQWLYRNLCDHVEEFVVCDPRRNRLLAGDGDKTNRIDALKLAELLRGGHIRAVYHSEDEERVVLKQWVGLYHDRVRDAVRQVNKIRARCRMYGVRPPRGVLRDGEARQRWLRQLDGTGLAGQLRLLFVGWDAVRQQVVRARQQLGRLSKKHEIIEKWKDVPGVGPIRAVTFLAYMDTPWRFANRKKRYKYCGVGLQRTATGSDRFGRDKPGKLKLAWACNKCLKAVVMGAAIRAIGQGQNVLADLYARLIGKGVTAGNARHAVARKIIDKMTAMWKTNSAYCPELA